MKRIAILALFARCLTCMRRISQTATNQFEVFELKYVEPQQMALLLDYSTVEATIN